MSPVRLMFTSTKSWRERVKEKLSSLGWSNADLARELGCSRTTIGNLLNGEVDQSPYVSDINKLWQWTTPEEVAMEIAGDEDADELFRSWKELGPLDRARLLGVATELVHTAKQRKKR